MTELAVILVWKLWTIYARMFEVTAILSCVIKIRGSFKYTKLRHFENVKFETLSAQREKPLGGYLPPPPTLVSEGLKITTDQ